jgi:hypothetical protein
MVDPLWYPITAKLIEEAQMREFDTGATRDTDEGKLDYEGFLSPRVLERFAEYMNKNRVQADGNVRASDNWQKGIPREAYMKSLWRHFMDVWTLHRTSIPCSVDEDELQEALCAMMFNVMGYLHEELAEEGTSAKAQDVDDPYMDPRSQLYNKDNPCPDPDCTLCYDPEPKPVELGPVPNCSCTYCREKLTRGVPYRA